MKKVKTLVQYGFGLNCDHETKYAFELAGAEADRVHLTDLYEKNVSILDYDILVFIGGFHSGDEGGAGVKWGFDTKSRLHHEIQEFVKEKKGLVLGICNGFQAIVKMGLLPGLDNNYDNRCMSVTYNDCGNFRDQWVTLKTDPGSPCIYTRGIDKIDLPIRHGEGKVIPGEGVLERLLDERLIPIRYAFWNNYEAAQGTFPDNPNGSMEDIAGICDPSGRVFGLMPHPEAYNHFCNHPNWTRQLRIPDRKGLGIRLLENAVNYVRDNR